MTPHHGTVILQILVATYTFLSTQLCYELQLIINTEIIKTNYTSLCFDMCNVIMRAVFHISRIL